MSKNVKVNGTTYNGVSIVQLPLASGGNAQFQDIDEITPSSGGSGLELKGTYTVKTTGYYYSTTTLDDEALTPSYESGMLVLVASSCDEDWSDNPNGIARLVVLYTADKFIGMGAGYRSGNSGQSNNTTSPHTRTETGAGKKLDLSLNGGNTYTTYLDAGLTVKKYEMELDSSIVESLMYYGS